MNAITIVLRSGMGMQLDAVRPYLNPGMPIAIGRAGAVIAEVADGNAIDDKRLAMNSAAGYIDSVERYMESAGNLESIVTGLESALIGIEQCAMEGQNGPALQAMDALRRIREVAAVFLDSSGARAERGIPASGAAAEPACPGAAAARRPVEPGERLHSAPVLPCCGICSDQGHADEACPWKDARGGLALVQDIDKSLAERRAKTPWNNGRQTAQQQENEYWRNLNAARYEWLRSAALNTGCANVPMVRIGIGDPLQGVALDVALNEAMTNWPIHGDDYYAHDAELQAKKLTARVSIFDVITGTANLPLKVPQELPSREEHIAQIERVAADLREHGYDRVQLKPCSFCGGPPAPFVQLAAQGFGAAPRLDSYGDDGLSVEAFVSCHECGARGPIHEDDIFDASDYDSVLEAGVDLWQNRDERHARLYQAGEAEGLNLFPRPDQVSEGGEL